MIALRNVLVATDFSGTSDVAVTYARVLAEAFGAHLHVLHVVPEAMALPWAVVSDGPSLTDVQRQWEHEAQERLRTTVPEALRASDGVTFATEAGDPVKQIVKYASKHDVDLLVIGTHGRGVVAHVLLGSIAEHVVRQAPCPVLTVRHPQHEFVTETQSALVAHSVSQTVGPA
jgi:nucleotide-binding universal stress UspA family protein